MDWTRQWEQWRWGKTGNSRLMKWSQLDLLLCWTEVGEEKQCQGQPSLVEWDGIAWLEVEKVAGETAGKGKPECVPGVLRCPFKNSMSSGYTRKQRSFYPCQTEDMVIKAGQPSRDDWQPWEEGLVQQWEKKNQQRLELEQQPLLKTLLKAKTGN